MFEFITNLTNYNAKSFKGKSVKDILAMKPSKVGDDFFNDEQKIAEAGLMEEQLDAIELLRDLKDKTKIFERCYKNKSTRRKIPPKAAPAAAAEPVPTDQPTAQPTPADQAQVQQEAEPPLQETDARDLVTGQGGGGRRSRRRRSSGRRSSCGHHKHTHKHGHKHNHKHKSRRIRKKYSGGAAQQPYFKFPVKDPPPIDYKPPVPTTNNP
jgi:hypothetical protein